MPMTDNQHHHAPDPVGDVPPGNTLVPITVWPVPAAQPGETMSHAMGLHLVQQFTHPSDLIIDLTTGPQLARVSIAASRRNHRPDTRRYGWGRQRATLIVTTWPHEPIRPVELFGRCHTSLAPGGRVAVLLPHDHEARPADIIVAAAKAGLAYQQHIVATNRPPCQDRQNRLEIRTDVLVLDHCTCDQLRPM
jgi:hypothetical protein